MILVCFTALGGISFAQGIQPTNEIRIAGFQGAVAIFPAGATAWTSAQTNQVLHPFDRLRTGVNSRAALLWSDQSVVPLSASTEIEILPPNLPDAQCGLHLVRGIMSFFHRDKPGQIQIITRGAVAGVEGTEFVMAVNGADATALSVIDGKVKLGNEVETLVLTNGEQAVADLGKAPVRTTGFIVNNILQWCFYYPAVLDPDELQLTTDEQKKLADSLAAYRVGDLPIALEKFPAQQSDSSAMKIYHAALLLSVGNVEDSENILSSLPDNSERIQRLAGALRELISAVKRQPVSPNPNPKFASEFLAKSYYEQSLTVHEVSLENALHLAKQAATNSPQFGFAWERVAELEFSFGRTGNALDALNKSLALAPRNPEALSLKGFLLAAVHLRLTLRSATHGLGAACAKSASAMQAAGAKTCSSPQHLNRSAQNCEVISARLTPIPAISRARQKNFNSQKGWTRTIRLHGSIPHCWTRKEARSTTGFAIWKNPRN